MMIHPADECPQDPKHVLDFTGKLKLPLLVNIPVVVDGPPLINLLVDPSAIRMQSGIGSDVELKEPVGVFLGEVGLWYHLS